MEHRTKLNAPQDLSDFVTFRLNRLQATLNSQAQHILKLCSDIGQSEWRVLILAVDRGESTMAKIVRDGRMDKAQVSRAVKSLIQKRYMLSRVDPDDQRQSILTPTETGQALHAEIMPRMKERQHNLLAGLSDDEIERFYAVLDQLEMSARARDF